MIWTNHTNDNERKKKAKLFVAGQNISSAQKAHIQIFHELWNWLLLYNADKLTYRNEARLQCNWIKECPSTETVEKNSYYDWHRGQTIRPHSCHSHFFHCKQDQYQYSLTFPHGCSQSTSVGHKVNLQTYIVVINNNGYKTTIIHSYIIRFKNFHQYFSL